MFRHSGLAGFLILAERRLIRLLGEHYGIPFTQVAEPIEHRGTRAAYLHTVEDSRGVYAQQRQVMDLMEPALLGTLR